MLEIILKNRKKNKTYFNNRIYFQRVEPIRNDKINKGVDFYLVGGMGHASSISLGVALKTKKKVIVV